MNIASCTHCSVVIDKDILWFPPINEYDVGDDIPPDWYIWDCDGSVPTAECPVCHKRSTFKT